MPAGSNRVATGGPCTRSQTTVDFARGNRLLTWYLGGLNFQIEHHLFPKICHVHYPQISRIVEQVCAEYRVRYVAHEGFLGRGRVALALAAPHGPACHRRRHRRRLRETVGRTWT